MLIKDMSNNLEVHEGEMTEFNEEQEIKYKQSMNVLTEVKIYIINE